MTDKDTNTKIVDQIFHLHRIIRQRMQMDSAFMHVTMQQLEALVFLKDLGDVQMRDVAEYFHITMPTATSLFNKLVEHEFVSRVNDQTDRRVVKVSLTEKGEQFLEEGLKQKSERMNTILSYLPEADKAELLRIMTNLTDILKKSYEK